MAVSLNYSKADLEQMSGRTSERTVGQATKGSCEKKLSKRGWPGGRTANLAFVQGAGIDNPQG